MATILDGIVIGGAGGAIAGATVIFLKYIHTKAVECIEKRRVYDWLVKNTSNKDGNEYRTTRAIASWNNLTEDRTRYICSIHPKIYLSTGEKNDLWSLYERGDRSTYEKRGIRSV